MKDKYKYLANRLYWFILVASIVCLINSLSIGYYAHNTFNTSLVQSVILDQLEINLLFIILIVLIFTRKPLLMFIVLIVAYIGSFLMDSTTWLGRWVWLAISSPFAFTNSATFVLNTIAAILFFLITFAVIGLSFIAASNLKNSPRLK